MYYFAFSLVNSTDASEGLSTSILKCQVSQELAFLSKLALKLLVGQYSILWHYFLNLALYFLP